MKIKTFTKWHIYCCKKLMTMFSIIKTGLNAINKDFAVLQNNIANTSTNGFKRSEAQFEDMYFSQHNNSTEIATGMGVRATKPRQSFSQGSFQQTGGSLDLAIMGEGFFTLGNPVGRRPATQEEFKYTRDGSFQLDRLGNLVNTDGLRVLGSGQVGINIPVSVKVEAGKVFDGIGSPILGPDGTELFIPNSKTGEIDTTKNTGTVPMIVSQINVTDSGNIDVTYDEDITITVARIALGDFTNEHGLQNRGNATFSETQDSGAPVFGFPKQGTIGKILAGALEKSNTDITDELVTMLRTQQAFNGCSKMLQSDLDTVKRLIS